MFLPGESHRQKGLVGYRLWGCKESDTTKQLIHTRVRNTVVNKVDISGIMGEGVQIFFGSFVQKIFSIKQYLLILALTDTYSHYIIFFI